MGAPVFARFTKIALLLSLAAFALAAVVAPPDPLLQFVYFAILLPAVVLISYLLA